jgi:hypothetical protein
MNNETYEERYRNCTAISLAPRDENFDRKYSNSLENVFFYDLNNDFGTICKIVEIDEFSAFTIEMKNVAVIPLSLYKSLMAERDRISESKIKKAKKWIMGIFQLKNKWQQ